MEASNVEAGGSRRIRCIWRTVNILVMKEFTVLWRKKWEKKNWEVNQILKALWFSLSNSDLIRKVIERYGRHRDKKHGPYSWEAHSWAGKRDTDSSQESNVTRKSHKPCLLGNPLDSLCSGTVSTCGWFWMLFYNSQSQWQKAFKSRDFMEGVGCFIRLFP